ncbi:MAG: diphthine--ammonia ligase [Candidatus Altiarchaeota archaeon]|nr:diphthine--ammonia ligase [Candidatus Altiarchaeota archaeon]
MKLAALTSGGKDSLYAVYLEKSEGHDIRYLLSMKPLSDESYMFHHPNIELTGLQSALMNIPLRFKVTPGEKEKELIDLEKLFLEIKHKVDGIITGAIASNYQKERIERICSKLGLECVSPLWHIDSEKYWSDLLDAGFEVIVSGVSAQGLGEEWLGRIIDEKALDELKRIRDKHGIHMAFEGGEAETFVLNCSMFSKGIKVLEAEKNWDGQRGTYNIKKVTL